jgi:UDP-N-acetyl-D-mannosaminuronate dehydrogenase
MYTEQEINDLGLASASLTEPFDAYILHTNHVEYKSLDYASLREAQLILDGRHFLEPIESWNGQLITIGRG